MDTLIIGVGNKARSGKDTFANAFKTLAGDDAVIVHWADALKDEITNDRGIYPLIKQMWYDGIMCYELLNIHDDGRAHYDVYTDSEVPYLDDIFTKRNIGIYQGMVRKDSKMLQFWGTDYRRKQDPDYWVKKLQIYLEDIHEKFIIIPDTRFRNEYDFIKSNNGIYVQTRRLNSDESLYYDTSRDCDHPSEIELDGVIADYTIEAMSGDIHVIEARAKIIYNNLK